MPFPTPLQLDILRAVRRFQIEGVTAHVEGIECAGGQPTGWRCRPVPHPYVWGELRTLIEPDGGMLFIPALDELVAGGCVAVTVEERVLRGMTYTRDDGCAVVIRGASETGRKDCTVVERGGRSCRFEGGVQMIELLPAGLHVPNSADAAQAAKNAQAGADGAGARVVADALDGEAKAVVLLVRHPDWTNKQIAKAVPCNRTTLNKWPRFMAARKTQKSAAAPPRGRKDKATGAVEAWDE